MRSPNMRSPVQDYTVVSPDYGTRMVDSQYRTTTTDQPSRTGADTSRSYGMADSSHSGTSATRQVPSYQQSGSGSATGSGIYQSGASSGYRGQATETTSRLGQ